MATKSQVSKLVKSFQSLQFYKTAQQALKDVLLAMPDKDYKYVTKNLIIVALHEGSLGQAMHFPNPKGNFKVVQLQFPLNIPLNVMRFVVAHEFGHVMQKRNWRPSDGIKLEDDATRYAAKIGFPQTRQIKSWMDKHGEKLGFLKK